MFRNKLRLMARFIMFIVFQKCLCRLKKLSFYFILNHPLKIKLKVNDKVLGSTEPRLELLKKYKGRISLEKKRTL